MRSVNRMVCGLVVALGWVAAASADLIVAAEDRDPNDGWMTPSQEIVTRPIDGFINNFGVASNTPLSQTFTVSSAFTLNTVELTYRTTSGGSYTLSIYEVANPTNSTISRIGGPLVSAVSFDIMGDSTDFAVAGSGAYSSLALSLTGVHQIELAAGLYYEIELARTSGSGLQLLRSGGNTYAGGTAYANGALVSPGVDRDWTFALSSAVVPEPSSALLIGLGCVLLVRRVRSRRCC